MAEPDILEANLKNIIQATSLKWILASGKGGVGKSTITSSLAIQLAKVRKSVLIISTDPAHNLSDAFAQQLGAEPTLINGFDNLYGMEVQPAKMFSEWSQQEAQSEGANTDAANPVGAMMNMLGGGDMIPGMDEIFSFAFMLNAVKKLDYDVVVCDTAPTGHTLRFLALPDKMLQLGRMLEGMQSRIGPMISMLAPMLGMDNQDEARSAATGMFSKLRDLLDDVGILSRQFKDPDITTFIAVLIPEFLPLYETERLIQSLGHFEIDCGNIVCNQVLDPDGTCQFCMSRSRMQHKYIDQIKELYGEDFHLVLVPLQKEEVRGVEQLSKFGEFLLEPYQFQMNE